MITFVVFSKNRPLQLHAYLNSLHTFFEGYANIHVIVRADEAYISAYTDVQAEFPDVSLEYEYDFSKQLKALVGHTEYFCFGCDDVVFVAPVKLSDAIELLSDQDILGISLRLGTHISHNMFWQPMDQPQLTLSGTEFITWNISGSTGDWGYPWEVLGTLYRTSFIQDVLAQFDPKSPSNLEETGWRHWPMFTNARKFAAWKTVRIVVPTINIVQDEFPNGICGTIPLSTQFLLECWQNNLRVDVSRYEGIEPGSWRIGNFFLTRI